MDAMNQAAAQVAQEAVNPKKKVLIVVLIVLGAMLLTSTVTGVVFYTLLNNLYEDAFYTDEIEIVEKSASQNETLELDKLVYLPNQLIVKTDKRVYTQNQPINREDLQVFVRYFNGEKLVEAPAENWWIADGGADATKNTGSSSYTVISTIVAIDDVVKATVEVDITVVAEGESVAVAQDEFTAESNFTIFNGGYSLDLLSAYSEQTREQLKNGYINFPIYKKDQINEDVVNFLVIGSGDTSDGRHLDLCETIIVVSYNTKEHKITAVSLLRDTFVPIEGYGWNKLMTAFRIGGPGLLINTVNDVYGLDIQYYIRAELVGLINLVDRLGGVTLNVTEEQINDLSLAGVSAGQVTLTGQNLHNWLVYNGRGASDVSRTERQGEFMKQLIKDYATGAKSISALLDICTEERAIVTNMPFSKLVLTVPTLATSIADLEFEHTNLPTELGKPYNYVCYKEAVTGIYITPDLLKQLILAEIKG